MRSFSLLGCLAAAVVVPWSASSAAPPNIVIMLGDDLGWGEIGAQGNTQIPTPHIDSISKNGIKFTNGYVSGPYCSPTRAGLMTGRYQTRFGHEFNPAGPRSNDGLPLEEKTFADRLKAQGYATGVIGKWHLGGAPHFRPSERGFDDFYGTLGNTAFFHPLLVDTRKSNDPVRVEDEGFYTTDAYAARAVEWIGEHKQKPFFLYLPFNAQHNPLQATQEYLDRFPEIKDEKRRTFAAMLSAMDDAVGDVLGALDEHGLAENTLVVYLTDNGGPTAQTTSSNLPLRGFKSSTLEGGVRVPFYAQWKGRLPAGKVYEHPVIQLDLLPTALAAAGAPATASDGLDGVNLLPYLDGSESAAPHDALYWRFGQQWAVRAGDWKLVAAKLDQLQPKLFNLAEDIGEAHDLSAEHPEKVAELKAQWEAWNEGNVPAKWQPAKATAKPKKAAKKAGQKAAGRKPRVRRAARAGAAS